MEYQPFTALPQNLANILAPCFLIETKMAKRTLSKRAVRKVFSRKFFILLSFQTISLSFPSLIVLRH